MAKEFLLKNESYFLLAEAVGGVYNADQLKIIAGISESESAFLKVTEDQALGLMVSPEVLPAVQESLRQAGLIPRLFRGTSQPSPRACLGELCPHCEQDALGDAISISSELAEAFPKGAPPLRIALNGCHQNCLASGTDDIHVVGEAEGYKLSIGGKAAELPQLGQFLDDNVQAKDLGGVLVKILRTYMDNREGDESFHDFVERSGTSIFTETETETETETDAAALDDNGLDPEHSADLLGDAELALAEEDSVADELSLDEVDHLLGSPLEEDAVLEEPDLESANLDTADLDTADLDTADLDTADLDTADLDTADLDTADLDSAEADETELSGTVPEETLQDDVHDEQLGDNDLHEAADLDALEDLDLSEAGADDHALEAFDDAESSETISMDPSLSTDEVPIETELASDESETAASADSEGSPEVDFEAVDEGSLAAGPDDAPDDALSLMEDESGLEEAQATDDDLARVTQAMRSEAALDQADFGSDGALSDLDSAAEESARQTAGSPPSEGEADFAAGAGDEDTEHPDLPRSFLLLQDQAADAGSLQVKLIEDTICIVTPEDARLNIPFASLQAGLRVVVNVGGFSFSAVIQEGSLAVKFGLAAISIPLSSIESSADEQRAA